MLDPAIQIFLQDIVILPLGQQCGCLHQSTPSPFMKITVMQVLGLERDDVIISLFAGIVTLASKLGSNIIVNLFCFCIFVARIVQTFLLAYC